MGKVIDYDDNSDEKKQPPKKKTQPKKKKVHAVVKKSVKSDGAKEILDQNVNSLKRKQTNNTDQVATPAGKPVGNATLSKTKATEGQTGTTPYAKLMMMTKAKKIKTK